MRKFFITFILLSTLVFSQSSETDSYTIKLRGGLAFSGTVKYIYFNDAVTNLMNNNDVYPGFAISAGIESPKLVEAENIYFSIAAEIYYGESSTGFVNTGFDEAQFKVTSVPVFLWFNLKTEGVIVPYLRAGIGAENSKVSEEYKKYSEFNLEEKDWFFAWGFGAGIDFNYLENIKLSIFADSILREKGFFYRRNDGKLIDFNFRNTILFCGIQFGYIL